MDPSRQKVQELKVKDRARRRKPTRSRFGISRSSSLFRLFAVLGPGLIAANAGNDAGGIATFSQAARESYLAISHRRLFIKALVTEWYRQKEEGEQAVSGEYAAAAIRGQSQALEALADSMQRPY